MRVESESWRRGGRSELVDCRVINVEGRELRVERGGGLKQLPKDT